MSVVNVGLLGTGTINRSESDSVNFLGAGTLNIAGTVGAPITVTLSQVAGVGILDTINISNADVTLQGVAGVSALSAYNIGQNGTLRLNSTLGVAAGSTVTFTGTNSTLVLGSGIDVSLLGGIYGFGLGNTIDASPLAAGLTYTDAPGNNTGGVITLTDGNGNTVGTVALATGNFTTSNFVITPDGSGGTLIQLGANVTTVTATPPTADITVGQGVSFALATSDAVTVAGGTPTLTLNDGGTATYNAAASTPTNLVFNYTVAAGQNTPDLAITAVNPNGATLTASSGAALNLAPAVVNPAGTLQVDTLAPTITSVTASPASGDLTTGATVTLTLTPSEAVSVTGGTPTLTLNDGGTATYNAGASTPTSLAFTTTVAAGQNTADLAVTAANLNGATIADGAGNPADLSGAVTNPAGTLQIDTTPPTITSVSASPANGDLTTGATVTLTLTPSEAVSVTGGTPTLTLNDGGTATYSPGASTPTSLAFTTTVAAGQNTPDLAVTAANLNGATIADGAGNPADLSGAVGTPAGTVQIDTTTPTITSVTASPANADLTTGAAITLTLTPSAAVTVTGGTPTLTLNDGGTATYNPGASTPTSLAFTTTVAAGQNTPDLAVTAANLNGATIADGAGNPADLSGAVANPAGILQIDTTPPSVTGVTTNPGSGTIGTGQPVMIGVGTTEPVTVAGGTPTLTLDNGGTATYDPGESTPTDLVFDYTVGAGQDVPDLTVTGTSLNGATITDPAGNAADLSGAITNPPGVLQVDTAIPTLTLTATPATADLGVGQPVTLNVAASAPVTVSGGTPTLTLNDGGTATYVAASSTPTNLVFTYTVAAGQNTPDLAVTAANLNGATITDGSGNAPYFPSVVTNPPGTLQIDTTSPTVTGVTTNPGSGTITVGTMVPITVATSEPVAVSGGTPTLTLNDGGTATYDPATSTPSALVFDYTVGAGQNTPDLAVTGVNLNGATVADGAGNPANLSGAVSNPPGVLLINAGINPFKTLVASSTDQTASVTVIVALNPVVAGTYSNLGTGSLAADGKTYSVTGTVGQVNAALAGVVLMPAAGAAAPAGYAASIVDNSTTATSQLRDTSAAPSSLIVSSPGDDIAAGQGADTLTAGSSGDILYGGPGSDVLVGNAAGSNLSGGSGSSVLISGGGTTRLVGAGAADTISGVLGNVTIVTASKGRSVVATGAGSSIVNSQGTDTIVGGSGAAIIGTAAASQVFLGSGADVVFSAPNTTVVGGAGADTVGVNGPGMLFYAGAGPSIFIGGTGSSTVIGGAGTAQVFFGGAGGGLFGAGSGGNNVIVGGQQATTIFGGGSGDELFAGGNAGTLLVAGAGNETLFGGLSSGADVFFAGAGNTAIALGSGSDVVEAGKGTGTAFGGAGVDTYAFANGLGGQMAILNFKVGVDHLVLEGFGASEAQHALATATINTGTAGASPSTTFNLSDNTKITIYGVTTADPRLFT